VGPDSQADLAGEGRVTACVAELGHLVKKRARPHVGVSTKRADRYGTKRSSAPSPGRRRTRGCLLSSMVLDCPPVSSDGAADLCARPPPFPECIDLQVFSLCDDDFRAPSSAQGIDTQSMGGPAQGVAPLMAGFCLV
jgi:hypothetical protein